MWVFAMIWAVAVAVGLALLLNRWGLADEVAYGGHRDGSSPAAVRAGGLLLIVMATGLLAGPIAQIARTACVDASAACLLASDSRLPPLHPVALAAATALWLVHCLHGLRGRGWFTVTWGTGGPTRRLGLLILLAAPGLVGAALGGGHLPMLLLAAGALPTGAVLAARSPTADERRHRWGTR